MAHSGDGVPPWVEPIMAASEASSMGERLRLPKRSMMNSRLPKQMVSPKEKTSLNRRSPSAATMSADEGTIKKHTTNPPSWHANCHVFCTDKIQGGQDHALLFRGGLANYKVQYSLYWFMPLLKGNNPMSSSLILKMNNYCNGVSRELEKFAK
jgi:hypothetical protein